MFVGFLMVVVVVVECFLSETESVTLLTAKQIVILMNNCVMAYVLARIIFEKSNALESPLTDDWKIDSE